MMRRRVFVLLMITTLVFGGAVAVGQEQREKVDLDAIQKIKAEGLERSQVMRTLSYMTDVHGPRLTASPGYMRAAEWAVETLKSWGLQNVHLERWGPFGRGWTLQHFSAAMVEPTYAPLLAYPKAWSPGTGGTVRGKVIHFDPKTEDDLAAYKDKLKGAIVLISAPVELKAHFEPKAQRLSEERLLALANADPPGDRQAPRRGGAQTPEQRAAMELQQRKLVMCVEEGAAAVLEITGRGGDYGVIFVQGATVPYPPGTPQGDRRSAWAVDAPRNVPQFVVSAEHYNRLVRMVSLNVPVTVEIDLRVQFQDEDLMGYNVIGDIPGTDLKDEIVLVGGHFDSWHAGTGATDNASGSAVAMEAVRIIQSTGLKPRRTIRIALWDGEEQGLHGSRQHVAMHYGRRTSGQNEPPRFDLKPAHDKFAAYFNLDNGSGRIRGIYLQGNEALRPIFRAWLAPFREMGASTISLSNTGGTDHLSFEAVGLPGFQFIQDPIEYSTRTHHTNMDVYDRLQADDMRQASVIMASFAYNAATRDQKLPRKAIPGIDVVQAAQ